MSAVVEHSPERQAIERLQVELSKLPQLQIETLHYFADGMYLRWVFRPKGALIIGKVHKKQHFYLVISGEVEIRGNGEIKRMKAPCVVVSEPGTKRAVYALEDSVCITIHRVSSQDLECIEREVVENDDLSLFDARNQLRAPLIENKS
jgi:hypothetical protein